MMRRLSLITCLSLALLAACGGGGNASLEGTGSSSGGSSGGGTTAASLTAMSSATAIPADGSQSAVITVLARNAQNNLISGVDVTFTAGTGGGISVTQGTTGTNGAATATLTAIGATAGTPITVTATAGGLLATVQVQVTPTGGSGTTAVASLTLTSSNANIYADGSTTATITAQALDAGNNVLSGVPVAFTTAATGSGTPGALQITQPSVTGPAGTLTAILSTGGNSNSRVVTVTGTTASLSSQVMVSVIPPLTPVMGNGTGSQFVAGVIGLGTVPPNQISAGGTTSLSVTITDQGGILYNGGPVAVTFNSNCIANGQAQILASGSSIPTQSITTTTGSIGATYVAKGCSGSDAITASAVAAGQAVSATGTVSIATAAIGSIQFVSATPTKIGLKGTGLNETSTVIFKVTDATGGAEANIPVSFSLDTGAGGLSLSPTTAHSASDGTVQTVVSAGTVHTAVIVTALISIPASPPNPAINISTKSSGLSVTTGLPASGSFSISVGVASNVPGSGLTCANIEGFDIDRITVPVTVQLFDRFGNPVPDGTTIAFQTDSGGISYPGGEASGQPAGGGSCTTPLTIPGDGACLMTWTSGNPRPGQNPYTGAIDLGFGYPVGYTPLLGAGRGVILASTIGEETFNDVSGSGFYTLGETFADLGDPFEDDNEQPAYEVGDRFVDFYRTGTWTPPSGKFIGITCTGSTPADTCSTSTLAIGASHLIVMSTSAAYNPVTQGTAPNNTLDAIISGDTNFTGDAAGGFSIPNGNSGTVTVIVMDQNGNAMPAGTTITWAFSIPSLGVTPTAIQPSKVSCDGTQGGEKYSSSVTTTAGKTGSGQLIITVTSPSGTPTNYAVTLNIT